MAKFMDKDPFTYEEERSAFVNQLRQFHAAKGTPFYRLPTIAGRELDLYLLYSKIVAWGGLVKVTDQGKWENLQEYFGIPTTCGHAAFALRQFYVKYLEAYERIHHQGEDAEEVLRSRSRPATPSSQPQKRNFDTRKGLEIPEQLRINAGLSTQKPRLSDYDKIMLSLQSGLPNEVDFAVNVCTLLSNEGRHVLHLERAVKLIDLLLAHCGVFYEGPGGFRSIYTEDWKKTTDRDFVTFWYDTVTDNDIREIIGPDSLRTKEQCKLKDPLQFTLRKLGLNDIEGQRILQVAIILRNLSFEDHNRKVMAAHRTFYRFLLLCIHNSCSALRQIGMDTLSNIAEEFILDPIDYRSTQLMFHTIDKAMKNQDKFIILRAMEVVEKLSQVDNNTDIIKQCMEERVYRSIIRLLTIHDVQLLLGALEVLLALSERGEVFCTRIASVERSVDILVCLVTLDAQSLGAEAFVGIKIVDHAPDGIHHPIVTMARQPQMSRATPTPPNTMAGATPPPPPIRTVNQQSATPPPPPVQQANRDADNEKFTCQWLHSFYEADTEAAVSRLELYSDYLAACSKASRVNMVTSTNFAKCIKIVFPGAGFQRVENETGPQVHITGLRKRALPLPFNWQLYQQAAKPSPNYQAQLGGHQSNLASSIMQRMAQRLSPSPSSSPSGTPQHRLYPQGMSSPGSGTMPPQMYRAGMIPGPSGVNTGSSTQLQQLILGHGLRHQNPATVIPQAQSAIQLGIGVSASAQQQQLQQQQQPQLQQQQQPQLQPQAQQQVSIQPVAIQPAPAVNPAQPNCPPGVVHTTSQAPPTSSDDVDMLSPQGSLVNQAGIPSAFLQNPLPQHSQTIANNDPSKSPSRNPASPGRAPPPYRPRSPAGSGNKTSQPPAGVSNSALPASPSSSSSSSSPSPSTSTKMPSATGTLPNQSLQEGEVKIEKIPNIHAQLPIDTNQVPATFPQEGSESFPSNSIPLLQTQTASADSNPEACHAAQQMVVQARPQEMSSDTQNLPARTGSQQVANIPNQPQQVFITQQQLQNRITINPQAIQIGAQGIQINTQAMSQPQGSIATQQQPQQQQVVHQQQQVMQQQQVVQPQQVVQQQQAVQGAQNIQMQIPASQVGVQQWIQAQPQGGQSNTQAIVNINGQGIVASSNVKGQPKVQIVQQGVISGAHGIQLSTVPVKPNFHIQKADGQALSQILPKSTPGIHQPQQIIVSGNAATTNNGSQMYSAYAVVQNVQRSVPTVLGQVTSGTPGQVSQGVTSTGSQSSSSYVPIQPKVSGQQQAQQQAPQQQPQQQQHAVIHQHAVIQPHQIIQQQQQQQQQPQQQFILSSIQSSLPQQSFAVTSFANTQQQQFQQQQQQRQQPNFTVTVGSPVAPNSNMQPVCPQNQPVGTVTINRVQAQGQGQQITHIDSPLIKQLLQSSSAVQPPCANNPAQSQVVNANVQGTVQWVIPQNPNGGVTQAYGNAVQGVVNIQGGIPQQGMPQPCTVNPTMNQVSNASIPQTAMHFLPPVCTSPSPAQSPALSCSSSSSPSSTSKSCPLSPAPSPQHKSEKKSKSKSHKSKKSSKKKKSKSGDRTPPIICSKAEHGKDVLKEQEKEASILLVENASYNDSNDQAKELSGDKSNSCNNASESNESKALTNSVGDSKESHLQSAPTCNGSSNRDKDQLPGTDNIQKLKSKLEEASLKQTLVNGYGSGDELDKKHTDVLIHRAELYLENTAKDLDKVLKSPRNRRKSEDSGHKDRGHRLSIDEVMEVDATEKPCTNHIMNGNIPSVNSDHSTDSVKDVNNQHLDNDSDKHVNSHKATSSEQDSVGVKPNGAEQEEPMEQGDSKKDRDSESDSGIVLNERTGFMHDNTGAIIPPVVTMDSSKPANQNTFCRDIRDQTPVEVLIPEANVNNNSTPSRPIPIDRGNFPKTLPQLPPQKLSPQSAAVVNAIPSLGSLTATSNSKKSSHGKGEGAPNEQSSNSKASSTSDDSKSEKSSKSSSKKSSGKRSRHSSECSKKRRMSSSSSSSSHHRKTSTSSNGDKSKHQQQPQVQQPAQTSSQEADFCMCEWTGCKRSFKTRKSLHVHTSTSHIMVSAYRGMCEWENCDNIQRQRWSCVSHVLEKHCSEQALQAASERRKQAASGSSTGTSTTTTGQLPTPILYNAHTAYHAIRRSLHAPSLKDLLGETEGPVTKSIRITAALVLKNLATHSADARSTLHKHEINLARLAISNAEASTTLAKCVGELNDERHLDCDSDDGSDS